MPITDCLKITGYFLTKSFQAIFVLAGVSFIAFILSVNSPGDPAYLILVADGNAEPTQREIVEMRQSLGLDQPFFHQYWRWATKALHGDLGRSFVTGTEIADEFLMRLPYTVTLAVVSMILSTGWGIFLGLFMASGHNGVKDRIGQGIAMTLLSLPDFWFAIILIGIFAETFRILPTSGADSPIHYILPAFVMAAGSTGSLARLSRTLLLNEMGMDYVTTVKSKGVSGTDTLLRHALPNAMIPISTSLGLHFGHILGGAVIVETIFAIPGLGHYVMTGILNRDYPVIQGFVLYSTVLYMTFNFLLDLIYPLLNPELRPNKMGTP